MLELFDGVEMSIYDEGITRNIRCLLLCVACDIPAGRKVCGFLGHMANLGCSKCYKKFSGSVGHKDYSGFDRGNWISRSGRKHRDDIKKYVSVLLRLGGQSLSQNWVSLLCITKTALL